MSTAVWKLAEVAEWARLDESTLRRWCRTGAVAHLKAGSRYRFTDDQRAAVLRLVEAKDTTTPGTTPIERSGVSPRSRLRRTA